MLYYVSIYISACCFEGCQVTVVAVSFSLEETVGVLQLLQDSQDHTCCLFMLVRVVFL